MVLTEFSVSKNLNFRVEWKVLITIRKYKKKKTLKEIKIRKN